MTNSTPNEPTDEENYQRLYHNLNEYKAGNREEIDINELYYKSENLHDDESAESDLPVVDKRGSQMRKLEARNPAEITTLPVFGAEIQTIVEKDENGVDIIKDVPLLRSSATSLRMCDTCFVAANCPAFKAGNTCAFNLPLEVKTKEQLRALLNSIVEMQGQRVAFARFSEEINGGYPDPNTGTEIDRLFKLIKIIKDLEDTSSFVKMTVEARNGGGVLSQIFGERASQLNELPDGGLNQEQVTRIIQQNIED